jgi:hypothetical protein
MTELREQIAKISHPNFETSLFKDAYLNEADQILALIAERIRGMKCPIPRMQNQEWVIGFEACRRALLAELEVKDGATDTNG